MLLYHNDQPSVVTVAGNDYHPDGNGVFNVPDAHVPALKKRGFVNASEHLRKLAEAELPAQSSDTGLVHDPDPAPTAAPSPMPASEPEKPKTKTDWGLDDPGQLS